MLAATSAMFSSATSVGASPVPTSPTSDAAVVAQGLVDLDDTAQQWGFVTRDVDATGVNVDSAAPTFVMVGGGDPMLLEGSDGVSARVGPAEGIFRSGGTSTVERALGPLPSETAEISIASAGATGIGEPFTPGAGPHDLELLHDNVGLGETVALRSTLPVLVFVAAGSMTDDGTGTAIPAGGTAVLSGDVILTNDGEIVASVFMAIIGPTLDLAVVTTTTSAPTTIVAATTPQPTTPQPTTPRPTPTEPPTTEPTTTPVETAPPSSDPPPTTAAATTAPPTSEPPTSPTVSTATS